MLLICGAGKILESPLDNKKVKPVKPKYMTIIFSEMVSGLVSGMAR